MLNLFADAGLPIDRHYADRVYEMTFALPGATLPAGDGDTALPAAGVLNAAQQCGQRGVRALPSR